VEVRGKRKKRKFLILVLLVALLSGCGYLVAFLIRYSATSEKACRKCHPELHPLWKNSKGHPSQEASCSACHSSRFKLIPENWNLLLHFRDQLVPPGYLADDELVSQRCLDCHPQLMEHGYNPKKKTVKFNHRIHAQENLSCVSCHRNSSHDYLEGSTNRPTIEDCLGCHFKEFQGMPMNQKCLNCHETILIPGKIWATLEKEFVPSPREKIIK